ILFGEMALVVSFALLCSLVIALTLVPVLGVQILRPGDEPPGWKGVLFRRASRMIAGVLDGYESRAGELMRRPGRVVLVAVVLLSGSVAAVPLVGTELLSDTDE